MHSPFALLETVKRRQKMQRVRRLCGDKNGTRHWKLDSEKFRKLEISRRVALLNLGMKIM